MPHTARKKSESGFYHVVPKGMANRIVFEDDADRRLYVRLLSEVKQNTGIRIHAYCLMSNHTHLILEDPEGQISNAMKYLHERYAEHVARKSNRIGGIFRKPFWSEPIETNGYLLCAVRYVHANPAHAGICTAVSYEWSSFKDYLGRKGITDTNMILGICGGVQEFIRFSQPENDTIHPFPGSKLKNHVSDDDALRIARYILGFELHELASMSINDRSDSVKLLTKRGFTRSCIMRITGMSRTTIQSYLA